jgi:uncharacterized RDD family membrane protein YckC
MVSAAGQVGQEARSEAAAPPAVRRVAALNARASAFLIDTVVLFAFQLVLFIIAGGQLLLLSDMGEVMPPDSSFAAFSAALSIGLLLIWTAFNVGLALWRGQSAGKYVVGIKIESEGGGRVSLGRHVVRWLGLHPLLFHPFLTVSWAIMYFYFFSWVVNRAVYVASGALLLLCLVAPLVALAYVVLDPGRRALHDRLAGTVVVHLDEP